MDNFDLFQSTWGKTPGLWAEHELQKDREQEDPRIPLYPDQPTE